MNKSVRIAGDELDEAIVRFARMKYGLVIGESTAEQVKVAVGSAHRIEVIKSPADRNGGILQTVVRGRDLESGLPKSLKFDSLEIREALLPVVLQIVEAIKNTLEETPPELVSDILEGGIVLAGGTSLLRGIDKLIAEETKMPVWRMEEPMTGVVKGCGVVLQNPSLLKRVKVVSGLRM